jgi:lysophospholipase L1-like esterase
VVPSPAGQPVAVTYSAPVAAGGSGQLTTACAPASGSTFPVGTTNVTCSATDTLQRSATCTFTIRVDAPPRLAATRITAFGDSITQGVLAACNRTSSGALLRLSPLEDLRILLAAVDDGAAYPTRLQALLRARYATQAPSVANEGRAGENATLPTTRARLQTVLNTTAPEVLLLQEGVNDLNGSTPAAAVAESLRTMVRDARARGVRVLLGTILPERAGSCRAFAPTGLIEQTNDLIRGVAAAEGATLVDLYAGFGGQLNTLLGEDGLHPSEAGYQRMAEIFYDRMRATLEIQKAGGGVGFGVE